MIDTHVFVDESGDPSLALEKKGVSPYFVLTALLVEDAVLADVEQVATEVIRKHFQKGEMKSSGVGSNLERRRRILGDIGALNFKHYSQVIDKKEIRSESGLRFKRSFVKFVHRFVYERLLQSRRNLAVLADEHGTSEFMKGFGLYLTSHLPRTLFETSTFGFVDSRISPLIQICDMIAGSVGRVYAGQDPPDLLRPIRENTIIIDEWPPRAPNVPDERHSQSSPDLDALVRSEGVKLAASFVEAYSSTDDPDTKACVTAVRYLLYHFRAVNPREYIPTMGLRRHLNELGYGMSERKLRSSVIGRLRDERVFVVSSEKGIKLPFGVGDLGRFVTQVEQRVGPYLGRLDRLRQHFKIASLGALDIVEEDRHPELYKLLTRIHS